MLESFYMAKYLKHTDICIGARDAISTVNFLPEVGLYNGVIGNVVEIVYQDRPVGPNDKQHYHLPDYVVVDFPHLKLPSNIAPQDKLHKTVSTQNIVLCRQANLKESSKSKELAKLRLQVLVVVKANDACESKKEIMRLRE
jgi:hypothetical protein